MKYKITVAFMVNEEDPDSAEIQVEAQLSDMMNSNTSSTIEEYELVEVDEIDEEEE